MGEIVNVTIKCPVEECGVSTEIEVPKYLFQKKSSIIKIQIYEGTCCDEHSFLVFLNKRGKVLGAEKIDHQIHVEKREDTGDKFYLGDLINKLGSVSVAYILHAVIFHYPIVLVFSDEKLPDYSEALKTCILSLVPGSCKKNVECSNITQELFSNIDLSDRLAIDGKLGAILHTPWENSQMDNEGIIMNRALQILDLNNQLVLIQEFIEKLYRQRDYIVERIQDSTEVFEEDLKEHLEKKFGVPKALDYHIDFLKQLITKFGLEDVSKIQIKSYSKLKDSLW